MDWTNTKGWGLNTKLEVKDKRRTTANHFEGKWRHFRRTCVQERLKLGADAIKRKWMGEMRC